MTGLQRAACLIGLAGALVLSTSGCDPYTYFNVNIILDLTGDAGSLTPQNRLEIVTCPVFVLDVSTGKKIDDAAELKHVEGPSACKNLDDELAKSFDGKTIGTMDYSTARSSGTLRFFVNMVDTNHDPIAQGFADGTVNPGKILSVNLLVQACGSNCKDTSQF